MDVNQKIAETGIVPVVVIEEAAKAIPLAGALKAGGIEIMEITFRTEAAADSISNIREKHPEVLVGAGTILDLEQCKKALDYGAQYIVSPGFDRCVAEYCLTKTIPIFPGCVTPSEIMTALKLNLQILKYFPADVYGGLKGMKALSGPFPQISFIPTGGVNIHNLYEYLSAPYVFAVGGSWLCDKRDINSGNFDRITALCKEAIALRDGNICES